MTYQQGGGLFSSKEQESETKAQLLKRLAFVIYSSEKDQYQKNMPEIQGLIFQIKLFQLSYITSHILYSLFRMYCSCVEVDSIGEFIFHIVSPLSNSHPSHI